MKRLLLLAYQFPPLAGSGVFRAVRFAKHLPAHGWEVTVLSAASRLGALQDASLLRDLPARTSVSRTGTLEPRLVMLALMRLRLAGAARALGRFWMIPDEQRLWVPFAVRAGRRLLAERRFDAIMSTSAPYSAHLAALRLRRGCDLPWVADFRDEWGEHPDRIAAYPTRWHRELNRRQERAVLRGADAVVGVSRPFVDGLRNAAPAEPADKFHVLPNGFDPEHFADVEPAPAERFVVAYTGVLYGPDLAECLLAGLGIAIDRGDIDPRVTQVRFIGHIEPSSLRHRLPEGVVRYSPHRPYFETIDAMCNASVLLLLANADRGPGLYPAKLFPYLASGRPVLALAPSDSVTADLIREAGGGAVVSGDDPADVADALSAMYREWRTGRLRGARRDSLSAFEADCQAGELARILETTVAGR